MDVDRGSASATVRTWAAPAVVVGERGGRHRQAPQRPSSSGPKTARPSTANVNLSAAVPVTSCRMNITPGRGDQDGDQRRGRDGARRRDAAAADPGDPAGKTSPQRCTSPRVSNPPPRPSPQAGADERRPADVQLVEELTTDAQLDACFPRQARRGVDAGYGHGEDDRPSSPAGRGVSRRSTMRRPASVRAADTRPGCGGGMPDRQRPRPTRPPSAAPD